MQTQKKLMYFFYAAVVPPHPGLADYLKFSPNLAEEEQGSEIQDGRLTL